MEMVVEDAGISRLRDSGDEGLAEALAAHHERLERIVDLRLDPRLAGRVDAADVLQEAFLEAKKRLPRYLKNPIVPVFVWLRGVTLDTLIHVHRRHLAKMRDAGLEVSLYGLPQPQVSTISLAGWLVADLTSPSQAAMRNEVAANVTKVLEAMDEIDREVLILRHFEQLSNDEVASIVGVKKAASSNRYVRALGRFRQVLETIPGVDFGN
jgi:RNA polymerase sigma-70 factor (ECF subfamily)